MAGNSLKRRGARTLESPVQCVMWGRPVACGGLSGRPGGLRAQRSLRGCPAPRLATFIKFLVPKAMETLMRNAARFFAE